MMVFNYSLGDSKSPIFFSVFWPVLAMLEFGYSQIVRPFSTLLGPLSSLWGSLRAHQLQLVSSWLSCYIGYYFHSIDSFSHRRLLMFSHWSLRDKSPQIFRTLLSILADLNEGVVWMVFTRSLISKSSSPWINSLVTVPRAPITTGITVTFTFHCFFVWLARSWYLSLFWLYYDFILLSARTAKFTIQQILFLFCWVWLGLVVWMRLGDPFLSQNSRAVCASHFPGRILGCAYICS